MGLPEDLGITGLKLQEQEILLTNHRPVLLFFYTFSLATTGGAPRMRLGTVPTVTP